MMTGAAERSSQRESEEGSDGRDVRDLDMSAVMRTGTVWSSRTV